MTIQQSMQEWDVAAAASQERDGIPSTAAEPSTSEPTGAKQDADIL